MALHPRVYFARAIEGISRAEVTRTATNTKAYLDTFGLIMVDANHEYLTWRETERATHRCDEHVQIVKFQLELLRGCDALLMDMTIADRNYVGCCCELVYAYQYSMPTAVYVGETDNGSRTWLKYHAEAIFNECPEAVAHLSAVLSAR